jgi:hypothetical protein
MFILNTPEYTVKELLLAKRKGSGGLEPTPSKTSGRAPCSRGIMKIASAIPMTSRRRKGSGRSLSMPSKPSRPPTPASRCCAGYCGNRSSGFVRVTGWLGSEIAGTLTRWLKSHTRRRLCQGRTPSGRYSSWADLAAANRSRGGRQQRRPRQCRHRSQQPA